MVMNQLEAPGAGTGFGYFASDRYLPDGKIAVYAFLLSPPHNLMFDSLMTKSDKKPSEIVFYPDEETKSKFREKINKIFNSCNVSHTSDKKDIRIEQTKEALGRSIQDAENQLKTLIQETQRLTKEIRRIENDAR